MKLTHKITHQNIIIIAVIDTWGKVPTGLLSGNSYDFGHYDQCVDLAYQVAQDVIEGQHCQLPFSESTRSFVMGVCIPAVCREETIYKIMVRFFENVELILTGGQSYYCTTGEVESYGPLQWTTVGLLIALGVGLLFSTVYDLINQYQLNTPSNILNSFSIYRNANALFGHPKHSTSMTCLNGIRVLSMAWIVLYHAYQEYDSTLAIYNRNDIEAVIKNFLLQLSKFNSIKFLLMLG